MSAMNNSPWFSTFLVAASLTLATPALAGTAKVKKVQPRCAEISAASQGDSAANASRELCRLIGTGSLAEMRWPSFADQRSAVESFYKPTSYALAWMIDANRPTPQALALIAALQNADRQGLRPEDYDGPRWQERLNRLQSAASLPAGDLARFDLALTVSVMRYVSDQYRGRLSPAHFQFRWPAKECNLAEILRNQLVKSDDAAGLAKMQADDAAAVAKAVKAGNWDAAAGPAGAIQKRCGACHMAHREQLPDKSFKFKP